MDEICHYISGFVDGEGSFHVAIQRNPTVRIGWQVVPEFHVSQRGESVSVLELIRDTLQCGYVKANHAKNPRDKTCVLVVKSQDDLQSKVIPFFRRYSLRTTKRDDFHKFAQVVEGIANGKHREREGLVDLLQLAFSMNLNGARRKLKMNDIIGQLKPSETTRQTSASAKD